MHPMFDFNSEGKIIPDGIDDPGYVLDCMAYGYMDDKTGHWIDASIPPPREYFNCLRFLQWRDADYIVYNGLPSKIRDIALKPPHEVTKGEHCAAMAMAFGQWAEHRLGALGIPIELQQQMTVPQLEAMGYNLSALGIGGADPQTAVRVFSDPTGYSSTPFPQLPAPPGTTWASHVYNVPYGQLAFPSMRGTEVAPSQAVALRARVSDGPPERLNGSAPGSQADGFLISSRSTSTSPALNFKDDVGNSPLDRFEPSRIGATVPAPTPSFSHGAFPSSPPSGALNSKAARPRSASQLPSTFDVTASARDGFVVLRVTDSPFNVTTNEILTHLKLGEREGLVYYGCDNPAIHIIQDRTDSKTHDIYIEMLDLTAAERVLSDIPKRGLKVGSTGSSRKIQVQIVTRESMMKAIFPRPTRSSHVRNFWLGDQPNVSALPNPFVGYVTNEDLHNAREWAEHPRKVCDHCLILDTILIGP
jgi:hypothetical protein